MFDMLVLSTGVVGGFVPLPVVVVTGLAVQDVFLSHTGLSISTHSNTRQKIELEQKRYIKLLKDILCHLG